MLTTFLISSEGKAVVESTTPYLSYVSENVVDGDTDSYSSGFCSHSVCKCVFHYWLSCFLGRSQEESGSDLHLEIWVRAKKEPSFHYPVTLTTPPPPPPPRFLYWPAAPKIFYCPDLLAAAPPLFILPISRCGSASHFLYWPADRKSVV